MGADNPVTSGDLQLFVEEAAEAVVSADVEMRDRGGAPVIDSGSGIRPGVRDTRWGR